MKLLGMFAKYPEAGRVKTRLAASVGAEVAAEVYRHFLATLLCRCAPLADQRQLAFAPAARQAEMEALAGPAWQVIPQSEGDLGCRMRCFFDAAFAGGASRVVLIGSDSPLLPLDHIEQAYEQLTQHDLVLGPSHDGGYYLVGAARRTPPIFDGISWSTSHVLQQTLAAATAAGVGHKLLDPWYDCDCLPDLQQLSLRLQETDNWPQLRAAVNAALAGVARNP